MASVCTEYPVQQRYRKKKTLFLVLAKDCTNEVRFCILEGDREITFNYKKRTSLLIEYHT